MAIGSVSTTLLPSRHFPFLHENTRLQIGPTIITNVTPDMRCYREEIFGPVLVCLTASSLDEAITITNANEYGNGACIFTESGSASSRFHRGVEPGQVGINVPIPVPLPMFSFTGNKRSMAGGGANYFYGKSGLQFYTQVKTVTTSWRGEGAVIVEEKTRAVNMPSIL